MRCQITHPTQTPPLTHSSNVSEYAARAIHSKTLDHSDDIESHRPCVITKYRKYTVDWQITLHVCVR